MRFALYIFCLLFLVPGQAISQESASQDATRDLAPGMQEAMKQLFPWLENSHSIQMGPYQLFRPNEPENSELWVVGPEQSNLVSINRNRVAVIVDVGGIGIDDRDSDGIYEAISYETIDSNGKVNGSVYDWDRDGVLDFKTVFSGKQIISPKVYVSIAGQWRLLTHKDDRSWVTIEDETVEVKKVGPKYVPVRQAGP
jgi:hypothetical protein